MVESIVFAGTPVNAAQTLADLISAGIEVSLVITRPDAPQGRKGLMTPSAVALKAEELGLSVYKTKSIDESAIRRIQATESEIGVIVAYGSILNAAALNVLPKGWYNLHYSLLPQLRGAAPVQHAIIQGLKETGVTLFKLDQGIDTGTFLTQVETKIEPGETSSRLLARLTGLGTSALLQDLPSIFAGTAKQHHQVGEPSFAPKIQRRDAKLDFSKPAKELELLVLGCNPEPGAWAALGGQSFKIHDAFAVETEESLPVGSLFEHHGHVAVRCSGSSALVLTEVQPSGRSRMQASDWRRGTKDAVRFD